MIYRKETWSPQAAAAIDLAVEYRREGNKPLMRVFAMCWRCHRTYASFAKNLAQIRKETR